LYGRTFQKQIVRIQSSIWRVVHERVAVGAGKNISELPQIVVLSIHGLAGCVARENWEN
jgi:hypothetical protein